MILRVVVKEGFYCTVTCTFIQTLSLTSSTSEVRLIAAMLQDGCGSACGAVSVDGWAVTTGNICLMESGRSVESTRFTFYAVNTFCKIHL